MLHGRVDANDGEDAVMNEVQDIDVEQIMERIRENIRRRRSAGDIPAPEHDTSLFAHGQVAADFAYLHSGYDITNVSLVSHRRILGSLVGATKKVIRKLLAPVLERQVAYNAASTRVTTHLKDWVEAQRQIGDTLREDIGALEARLRAELRAELRGAARQLARQAGAARRAKRRLSSCEAELARRAASGAARAPSRALRAKRRLSRAKRASVRSSPGRFKL